MAVNDTTKSTTSLGRRLFWGTNVTLAVLLVAFLVVVVNILANKYNQHKDVSGGLTGHRLSERTKRVLDKAGPITVSSVYTSMDPEHDARQYLPKLRDYCEEVARYDRGVTIRHLSTPEELAKLRDDVSAKFGSATGTQREVMKQVLDDGGLWDQLKKTLDVRQREMEQFVAGDSWLKNFSSLAGRAGSLAKLSKNLEDTSKEVKDMVEGEGLPRYGDARSRITMFNDGAKKDLQDLRTWAKDMDKLARTLSDPNAEFAKVTREKNKQIVTMVTQLREIAGDPQDTNVPDDTGPVLKKYATVAKALSGLLFDETGRVQAFLKDNPGMRTNSKWAIPVESGLMVIGANGQPQSVSSVMSIQTVLADGSEAFSGLAQQLGALPANTPKDQLQSVVRQLREVTARLSKQLRLWVANSVAPFDQAGSIDEASKKFLAEVGKDDAFKDLIKEMDDFAEKSKAFPEQKMDEIGENLKKDNIIVVENEKQVRIVPFDDVFPLVDRRAAEAVKKEGEPPSRDFNGDSAIANAILDMQSEKPFATVILVGYESQPPPQMRQFQRPMVGLLPLDGFQVLKDRLKRANFAVKEWNLCAPQTGPEQGAAPKGVPEPPAPEKGTEPIYVFLPPAEQPPMSMFMQQAPQKSFGENELKEVRKVLEKDNARAIFLTLGIPKIPSNPPEPGYAYDQMLEDDWGIQVLHNYRLMTGVPSAKQPGLYNFDPISFQFLRLNYFTDQPIGKPLRSRRVLVGDSRGALGVCPVIKVKDVPNVKVEPVLDVPVEANNIWAEGDLEPVVKAIFERKKDSAFAKSDDVKNPPFPVILAAENTKTKARVVVMGNGSSMLSDYLDRPVPRIEAEGGVRFSTDPPPVEDAELFQNALYWLGGRTELIAAGPADVPFVGPIKNATRNRLWGVTMGWALAVLVIGGAVMFIRRR